MLCRRHCRTGRDIALIDRVVEKLGTSGNGFVEKDRLRADKRSDIKENADRKALFLSAFYRSFVRPRR